MHFMSVVPLEAFKKSAGGAGVSRQALRKIVADIRSAPGSGHMVAPLFDEVGKLPRGGFYARAWRFRAKGQWKEGRTLHLYFSQVLPVYLWNFSTDAPSDLSWNDREACAFLVRSGQEIFAELVTSEVAE